MKCVRLDIIFLMYCAECGSEVKEGLRFCNRCGASQVNEKTAPPRFLPPRKTKTPVGTAPGSDLPDSLHKTDADELEQPTQRLPMKEPATRKLDN